MSSAQLDTRRHLPQEEAGPGFESAFFALHEAVMEESPVLVEPALKQQVAARLASHRARRQRIHISAPTPAPSPSPTRVRAARIAAAVAERYANTPSYHAVLASEADAAIRQAEAIAEAAAAAARAVTEAQLDLLEEIAGELEPMEVAEPIGEPASLATAPALASTSTAIPSADVKATPTTQQTAAPHMTVRLYEETAPILASTLAQALTNSAVRSPLDALDIDEALALDEEIAFRQSPTFEDITPQTDIPANLIQFPRQLIAARRARPRLAEGPLRDDAPVEEPSQLRIFEVEPTQLSSAPAVASAAPEWTSIMLGAQPVVASTLVEAVEPDTYPTLAEVPLMQTAPLELRIMAAAVDSCIVLAVMLAFTAAAVLTIGTLPALQFEWPVTFSAIPDFLGRLLPGAVGAAAAFVVLTAIYQALFFTFSDSTPGMTYARIGLCTFSDDNPTRSQMRRRVLAFLVSACPLGLGLIWSWIDTDRLGWHDRLSRMYQRSY